MKFIVIIEIHLIHAINSISNHSYRTIIRRWNPIERSLIHTCFTTSELLAIFLRLKRLEPFPSKGGRRSLHNRKMEFKRPVIFSKKIPQGEYLRVRFGIKTRISPQQTD